MVNIKLSNGVLMPILGFGVYQISKEECERCVLDALSVGYRHIDTAQSYFNEEEVGNAIVHSNIPREEIFITTKVWIDNYGYEETKKSLDVSLKKLKTTYIDLVLLHQPFNDIYGAWHALEEYYTVGKIRAIGISNFASDRMIDIVSFTKIKPQVNQIEINPFNQQIETQKWNEKYQVQVESWAPFAEGRNDIFNNETLKEIGKKYHKSNAQVIIRWLIQRGIPVFPKSTHIERMKENFNVFDFELTSEDMNKITTLDQKKSMFFSHQDPTTVEWFVNIIQVRKNNQDLSKEKKNW